ncbi:MAG TPA: hypothetical protein VJY37_00115 [Anaerovoracaceae bacterium]|nr:hypothetical protein [Anaerovoracaceae bacterium]
MRKFNFICSILIVVMVPLMIVTLSANLTLRIPDSYKYYFNDSEILDEIPYYIGQNDMASAFSSYFNAFNDDPFQVYEDNGMFQDPIYDSQDVHAMKKYKRVMTATAGATIVFLILSLAIFIYLYRKGFKAALRNRYKLILPLSVILMAGHGLVFALESIRHWMYAKFIGVKLAEDSLLQQVLGGDFFGTYIMFSTIIGAAIIGVLTYVVFTMTKPPRIFF